MELKMAKLFALEDSEVMEPEIELESSAEIGEVAEAQVETEADISEIEDSSEAIQEGVEAADQLEEVQDVVKRAADEGGLEPMAAEAIRIAIEAICARVGANPKSVYALYAAENFQSVSSRKANTQIALEGIGEFLKNLWEKIKSALTKIWDKVVDFWNKHLSNLGRVKKALESLKEKIGKTKGVPEPGLVTVPASLQSIFPVKASLGVDEIKEYKDKLINARNSYKYVFETLEHIDDDVTLNNFIDLIKNIENLKNGTISFGNENDPMPGGKYDKWEIKLESENDDGVIVYTLDVDEDHGDYTDGRKDAQLDIPSKDKLKELVNDTLKDIKEYIKYKDKAHKRAKQLHENLKAIDKEVDNLAKSGNVQKSKEIKLGLRAYFLIRSKGPAIETKLASYTMAYYRGVVQYVSTCLKHYKTL